MKIAALLVLGFLTGLTSSIQAFAWEKYPVLDPDFQFECSLLPRVGCSGVFPVRTEKEAELALLTNGERSLAARIRLLESAQKSIRVQALIFSGDESGTYIAEILKRKRKKGLDVRVIVDAASNFTIFRMSVPGVLLGQTQWMYYDLKQNGIEVEGYEALGLQGINEVNDKNPKKVLDDLNKRYHDKMWVIDAGTDNATAVLGGMNIANEYFRVDTESKNIWRDQDILVRGKVVDDVAAAFDRDFDWFKSIKKAKPINTDKVWDWWRKTWVVGKLRDVRPPYALDKNILKRIRETVEKYALPKTTPARMRFIQSRPRLEEHFIHQAYVSILNGPDCGISVTCAKLGQALIANAYFVPKGELVSAMHTAARQGARVRVLTNSLETNDLPALSHVGRYLYKNVLEANFDKSTHLSGGGIEIHEWDGPSYNEGTIHAKFAVFDREAAIVGSYNLDPRSEWLNSETVLVFENREVAAELADQFENNDVSKSHSISWQKALEFHEPKDVGDKFNLTFSRPFEDWY